MTKGRIDYARVLALFVVIFAVTYFNLNIFRPRLIPNFMRIGVLRSPVNILVLGTDMNFDINTRKALPGAEGRADTIILVRVDPARNKVNVLSIPRDTLAFIPGYGQQKINAANVYGGVPLLSETVTRLTGQKIDYYFEIKPQAITKLVDLLGGVTVDIEKDMRYTDRAQKLDINLKAGRQKLSGQQAHDFIRFRHDAEGDIGRIRRQQEFLKAMAQALTSPGNLLKAPFAISAALREVNTNLPLTKSVRLANLARMTNIDNINTVTASGSPEEGTRAGSIWKPDKAEIRQTIKDFK